MGYDMTWVNSLTNHLDGDMTIEALPTWYANTVFRSALEAFWAATLDTLHITWEYEPETITLPSGAVYVPGFWLPHLGTWIEVKGHGVPRVEKAHERACTCSTTSGNVTTECDTGQVKAPTPPPRPVPAPAGMDALFDLEHP